MKKTILAFLLCMAAMLYLPCCISCTAPVSDQEAEEEGGEKPGNDKTPEEDSRVKPQPGEYTFTVSSLKGKWEAGDKIYIHGSYAPKAEIVTLKESDISADGLTATANLNVSTEFPVQPDGLYAAWPADAVAAADGIIESSTDFETVDGLMAVAYLNLEQKNFAFTDASSALKFSASGYTRFALAGSQRPGLRFNSFTALYTSEETDLFDRKTDGYPFMYGNITHDGAFMWIPGTLTLKKGMSIYLGTETDWPVVYTIDEDVRFSAGEIKDLGDITSALKPYTGPDPKMPEMGKRTKYTLKINELSALCVSKDNDFLWGLGDGGDLVKIFFDGTFEDVQHCGGDTEGVSIDPATDNLIISGEPGTIYYLEAPDYTGKLKTLFYMEEARKYGNAGLEGITYYKDNMFYAGAQTNSNLFLCKLDAEVDEKKNAQYEWMISLREKYSSITEIADLCYDPLTDWLWVLDSESRKFFALTGDTSQMLGYYSVKGTSNPEAIAVDHANSCIWIGDDYGSTSYLYKYEFTGLDDAIITQ